MARICFSTTLPPDVRETTINGYTKYVMVQTGAGYYNEVIDCFDDLFTNRTYYFTSDSHECSSRIMNNLSDVSSEFVVFDSMVPKTRVPVPFAPSKESVTSAYNLNRVKKNQFASALSNFKLLDELVYLVILILLLLFIVLICFKVMTLVHHSKQMKLIGVTQLYGHRFTSLYMQVVTLKRDGQPTRISAHVSREIFQSIYGSSTKFKLVAFLISLLSLFVVAAFSGTYSTSRIVTQEPSVIESLVQLIASKTALPIFYNQQSVVSDDFKRAPASSIKGKVWYKLMNSQADLKTHIVDSLPLEFRAFASNLFDEMQVNGSVIIANAAIARVFVNTICSSSPEDELWHFVISVSEHEREISVGFPFYEDFNEGRHVHVRIRRYFEAGMVEAWYWKTIDIAFSLGWMLSGTSKDHKFLQQRICTEASSADTASPSQAITIDYYVSFSHLLFSIYTLALILLLMEVIYAKVKSHSIKRQRFRAARLDSFPS